MPITDRKIPIYTGINDIPSTEGNPNHPNASLLCWLYNNFIDDIDSMPITAYEIALDNGFNGTVTDWLTSLQGGMNWTGVWNSSTNYLINDGVFYQGSAYLALTNNVNKPPSSNPTDWDMIAQAGQSIDHVSLTNTSGLNKTYTVWGDTGETINMGGFTVTNGEVGATGTVSASTALELLEQGSSPAPIEGKTLVYAKTDGKLYQLPDTGVETLLGSGTGGSINDIWLYGGI